MIRATLKNLAQRCSACYRYKPPTPSLIKPPILHNIPKISGSLLYPLSDEAQMYRHRAICLLRSEAGWQSCALLRMALRNEIDNHVGKIVSGKCHKKNTDSADIWFLNELVVTMRAFDVAFLAAYDLANEGASCSKSIREKHALILAGILHEAFRSNSEQDRLKLAAALDPEILTTHQINLTPEECKQAERLRENVPATLNADELLAMLDYLHPYTMIFNVLNGGQRLKVFWGVSAIADASAMLYQPFLSGLRKLSRNPAFADDAGIYYKGIKAKRECRRIEEMLTFLCARGGIIMPPHPISATREINASFACMEDRPEDSEMVIKSPSAINVGLLHGRLGKQISEVILLPVPLRVVNEIYTDRNERPFKQTVMLAEPASTRSAPRWRKPAPTVAEDI